MTLNPRSEGSFKNFLLSRDLEEERRNDASNEAGPGPLEEDDDMRFIPDDILLADCDLEDFLCFCCCCMAN